MSAIIEEWVRRGAKITSQHDRIQFAAAMEYIEKISFSQIRTLADIGAGPGHQSFVFHSLGVDVTCVDFVAPLYKNLRWVAPDQVTGLVFDALWSHHCLEHIPNPINALTEWRKLLVDDGRLFLTVPEIGLTMSTGHINNFNLPLLVYSLAIAGFDCSEKRFIKSRSHLRASVRKARNYAPEIEGHISDLRELAARKLFSPSVTRAIEERGRFSARDMHLDWFGKLAGPNPMAEEAYSFVTANIWNF